MISFAVDSADRDMYNNTTYLYCSSFCPEKEDLKNGRKTRYEEPLVMEGGISES